MRKLKKENEEFTEEKISRIENPLGFQIYQPEIWSVEKDIIYDAITSVRRGLEYAKECLTTHDNTLGRTTMKNEHWANTMEEHILHMEMTLKRLQECDGKTK